MPNETLSDEQLGEERDAILSGNLSGEVLACKSGRCRKIVKVFSAVLAVLAVVLLVAGYWVTRPERLTRIAHQLLETQTGTVVTIGEVRWSSWSELTITDLAMSIRPEDWPGVVGVGGAGSVGVHGATGAIAGGVGGKGGVSGGELLEAERVTLRFRWLDALGLLGGPFLPRDVYVLKPTVYLTEDVARGSYVFQFKSSEDEDDDLDEEETFAYLPEIYLRQARLQLGRWVDGQYEIVRRLQGDATLNQGGAVELSHGENTNTGSSVYHFAFHEHGIGEGRDEGEDEIQAGEARNGLDDELKEVVPASPLLAGQIDLNDGSLALRVRPLSFGPASVALFPQGLRAWWERFQPTGDFTRIEFGFVDDDELIAAGQSLQAALRATIELQNGAMDLAFDEMPEDESSTVARMTGVHGTFVLGEAGLSIENLTGQVTGIDYTINGRFDRDVDGAMSADGPFEIEATTGRATIPAESELKFAVPPAARKIVAQQFERLSPWGEMQVDVKIGRSASGGEVTYVADVELFDSGLAYYKFPLPVHTLYGRLIIDKHQVELKDWRGQLKNGGALTLEGTIAPPGDLAEVDLQLVLTDLPLDYDFRQAIPDKDKSVFDLFFDDAAFTERVMAGLLRGENPLAYEPSQRQPKQEANLVADDEPYLLSLGGTMNAAVHVYRPPGYKKRYQNVVTISAGEAGGVRAIMKHWPYPVTARQGRLVLGPGYALIEDVVGESPTGGRAKVSGRLDRIERGKPWKPTIDLAEIDLPIDDLLLASIPDRYSDWIRQMGMSGRVQGDGSIFLGENGEFNFHTNLTLAEGDLDPAEGELAFDQVEVAGQLTRFGFVVDEARANIEGYPFNLTGKMDWSEGGEGVDLRLHSNDLPLSRQLLSLIPQQANEDSAKLKAFFDQYQPEGQAAVDLHVQGSTEGDAAMRYRVALEPKALAFTMNRTRVELEGMSGSVTVDGSVVSLDEVRGELPSGAVWVDGILDQTEVSVAGIGNEVNEQIDEQMGNGDRGGDRGGDRDELTLPLMDLKFGATGERLDDAFRSLLPDAVATVLNRLAFDSSFVIEEGQVVVQDEPGTVHRMLAVNVPVAMSAGGLKLAGLNVEQVMGAVDLDYQSIFGSASPKRDWTLDFAVDSALVFDRQLRDMTMRLRSDSATQRILVEQLSGDIYGGVLSGGGGIQLGGSKEADENMQSEDGRIGLRLTLNNADAPSMLDPSNALSVESSSNGSELTEQSDQRGTLSASLELRGLLSQLQDTVGRGDMKVSEAALFSRPLAMAVMAAANLNLPATDSFETANAKYRLEGQVLYFDELELKSSRLQMLGSGKVDTRDGTIDLVMFTANPASPNFGPLSEMFAAVRDEIIAIEVTGTLAEPKTENVSFRGIRSTLAEILGRE